jgi:hypothetical protein
MLVSLVRPTARTAPPARCSSLSHSFGCPGSGSMSSPGGGRNPGPVSWECRNTACARKGKRKYNLGNMRRGRQRVVHHSSCFAHAPAPGRRVRAFYTFDTSSSVSCIRLPCLPGPGPGCPAFSIRSRDCTTPPGTANQDVSVILVAARTWPMRGKREDWVWMWVTCRVR